MAEPFLRISFHSPSRRAIDAARAARLFGIALLTACSGESGEPTGPAAQTGSAPVKVAVVDVEQVFQRSPLMMALSIQLTKEFAPRQGEIKRLGRDVAALRRRLSMQSGALDTAERAALEAVVASKTAELRELQETLRADLAAARSARADPYLERVTELAAQVAAREGMRLVVGDDELPSEADAEGAGVERVDITEQVIRALLERMNPTEIPETDDEPAA